MTSEMAIRAAAMSPRGAHSWQPGPTKKADLDCHFELWRERPRAEWRHVCSPVYPHEIITNDGTLGLAPCSLPNNEAFVMMRKRISFRSELTLERRWSKVRRVTRQARNSRKRADMWGNELTHYLNWLSLA
jgi:hypothetical protein